MKATLGALAIASLTIAAGVTTGHQNARIDQLEHRLVRLERGVQLVCHQVENQPAGDRVCVTP